MKRAQGSSLIEVLVALSLSSAALLSLAQLQYRALAWNEHSERLLQAQLLSLNLGEMMRANPDGASAYRIAAGEMAMAAGDCRSSACDPAALARWQLAQALTQTQQNLRGDAASLQGAGIAIDCPSCSATPIYRITVLWDLHSDPQTWQCGAASTQRACLYLAWQP